MTKEEKKERRELRHQLQKLCKQNVPLYARLKMTPNQTAHAGRVLADRILSGKDPNSFVAVE